MSVQGLPSVDANSEIVGFAKCIYQVRKDTSVVAVAKVLVAVRYLMDRTVWRADNAQGGSLEVVLLGEVSNVMIDAPLIPDNSRIISEGLNAFECWLLMSERLSLVFFVVKR